MLFYKENKLSENNKFKEKALEYLYNNRWSDILGLSDELNRMLDKWSYGEYDLDEAFNAVIALLTEKSFLTMVQNIVPKFMKVVNTVDALKGAGRKFLIGSLIAGLIFNVVADILFLVYLFL